MQIGFATAWPTLVEGAHDKAAMPGIIEAYVHQVTIDSRSVGEREYEAEDCLSLLLRSETTAVGRHVLAWRIRPLFLLS